MKLSELYKYFGILCFVFLGFSLHQKNILAGCNERSCSIEKKPFFQKKLSKEKLVLEELLANLFLVTEINDNYSKETKNSFDESNTSSSILNFCLNSLITLKTN